MPAVAFWALCCICVFFFVFLKLKFVLCWQSDACNKNFVRHIACMIMYRQRHCPLDVVENICHLIRPYPRGFKISYIVPIPKPKEFLSKSLSYDDFRGIAISPIISKVFEYCFLDRFGSLLSSSDNQFGFKKDSGCRNAIYTFRKVVDSYVTRGTTVNICSIDLSKAFDKVNHYACSLN